MPRVTVTIGMPVYNGERYLVESLECVLAQDFDDFELLIADNASMDSTEEICREYAARDRRIRYHRQPTNIGIVGNIDYLMRAASGKYYKNYSHDDRIAPNFLSTCVRTIEEAGDRVVLVYPRTGLIDADGKLIGAYDDRLDIRDPSPAGRIARFTRNVRMINIIHGLYRTDDLQALLPLPRLIGFDNLLFAELALRGEFREVPDVLFFRRSHPESFGLGRPTTKSMARAIDPDGTARAAVLPLTRLVLAHIRGILRAPISPWQRAVSIVRYLLSHARARLRHHIYTTRTAIKATGRRLLAMRPEAKQEAG